MQHQSGTFRAEFRGARRLNTSKDRALAKIHPTRLLTILTTGDHLRQIQPTTPIRTGNLDQPLSLHCLNHSGPSIGTTSAHNDNDKHQRCRDRSNQPPRLLGNTFDAGNRERPNQFRRMAPLSRNLHIKPLDQRPRYRRSVKRIRQQRSDRQFIVSGTMQRTGHFSIAGRLRRCEFGCHGRKPVQSGLVFTGQTKPKQESRICFAGVHARRRTLLVENA